MIRKSLLYIFIFFLAGAIPASAESFKSDSLQAILKNKSDAVAQKRDLILYLRYLFGDMPEMELDAARNQAVQLLRSFHEDDSEGIINFIDAICQVRRRHYAEAQNLLLKAVEQANQYEDHYLLYACFTHLAFLRTDEGNVIAAISSFRAAKKEATIVNDAYLQVVIDINLSDIYYRNAMFNQAKFYLNEGKVLLNSHHIENQRMENGINYNMAEVCFRTQNIDSLKKYNQLLRQAKKGSFGLYTFQKRTDYYVTLLERKYAQVIQIISALAKDSLYEFKPVDRESLANAYFGAGMLDSAKAAIVGLIKTTGEQSHTEQNLRYYRLLGDIENKKGDYENASEAYNAALAQTQEQLRRLINVGSVSSQIQIDQVQNSYALRTETYKRERLWLIFIITAITLFIIIGALLYYNMRRNKYYEKLLFESKKNEIAFINSHEVRRHASNIMGIVQVIHQAENKYENFLESEEHLINELNSLDKAIRDISDKLSG